MVSSMILLGLCARAFSFTDSLAETLGTSAGSPPIMGNFALPNSQQPGPLLSFGQTIIDRNQLQISLDTFSPYHLGGAFDNVSAALTYGITDSTALYFNYPIAANPQTRVHHSSSLLDILLQLEQAVYTAGNTRYQDQATVVGGLTIPIKDATSQRVPQGFGAPTFFGGTTFNRTFVDWMGFISPGVLLTTSSDHVRLGSQYLYQAGIGHNIASVSDESILFALLEFDGQYTEKNQFFGRDNPNTGGNVMALTPSISFSSKKLMVQAGVGFPVVQHLFGHQTKMHYFVAANLIWTVV